MILKTALVCAACMGVSVAAPALAPPQGSATERVMTFGMVPAFLVKLSNEQDRWDALNARPHQTRRAVAALAPMPQETGNGIPPWHIISLYD